MPVFRISLSVLALAVVMTLRTTAAAEPLSTAERSQLRAYAADTWRSLTAMVQPSGLPADGLHRGSDGIWVAATFTSPTNIAAYLWNVLAAESLKLITPEDARLRLDTTLSSLEAMERSHGFFYNWYDPASRAPLASWPGKPGPLRPFLSSVDNGWLAASLMMIGNARPDFAGRTEKLLRPMDFAHFYDAHDPADPAAHPGLFHVGSWPDTGVPTASHYGMLNTEARIISYVAISRGQVPADHYYRLQRTLPAEQAWQQQVPTGRVRNERGVPVFEGHYTYHGIDLVPSWGGSMFEALMVTLFVPEAEWAPESWGVNHPLYVRAHVEFGRSEAGLGVWGFSPSSRPGGGYQEYGVPALGTRPGGYPARDPGSVSTARGPGYVVTPHASFLALAFDPVESLANLTSLADNFKAYGPLGFYDAVNLNTGQVAESVLALDQGMILSAIANALDDHVMQHLFSDGAVETAIRPLIAPEHFTSGLATPRSEPGTTRPAMVAAPGPASNASRSAGQ